MRQRSLTDQIQADNRADMAWEAPFEERIIRSRQVELKQLRKSFILEVAFEFIWTISPMVCTLVAFLWYTKVSQQVLTPSIAFTSLAVFNEMKFALNVRRYFSTGEPRAEGETRRSFRKRSSTASNVSSRFAVYRST